MADEGKPREGNRPGKARCGDNEDAQATHPGSEEHFRFHARFLDAVSQCVIATEPIGIVTCRNRVAGRVYGLAAGAVLGRHLDEMLIPELLQRWAEGTTSRSGEWDYCSEELEVMHREGITLQEMVTCTASTASMVGSLVASGFT